MLYLVHHPRAPPRAVLAMPREGQTQKGVWISDDVLERFEEILPMQGAFTWFVRTSLRKFVELHDVPLEDLVELGVKEISEEEF